MAECRVEKYTATESFTRELYHSGCRLLINGMETGSQRIMHLIRKGVDLERGKGYLQLCQNAGIRTGWMFFIGFPGETLEEAEETFRYIESCESELNFTSIGTYSLERDSPVWNDPSSFGITEIIGKDEPYRLQFDYVDQNGVLHQRHTLDKLLARMISEYPRLLTKLCAIVDRSCGVFFDETN
jgi:hypothetical protein